MKTIGVIPTVGEPYTKYAVQSLSQQTHQIDRIVLLQNVAPLRKALNASVAIARDSDADLCIHVDSDMVLHPYALETMWAYAKDKPCWGFTGFSEDVILGRALAGVRVYVVDKLGSLHYGQGPTGDAEAVGRQDIESGLSFLRTAARVGFHHPIWTAKELYMKLRFSLPKYPDSWVPFAWATFFTRELATAPDDPILRMGWELFQLMMPNLKTWQLADKNLMELDVDWEEFKQSLSFEVKDTDWWALLEFERTAEEMYGKK